MIQLTVDGAQYPISELVCLKSNTIKGMKEDVGELKEIIYPYGLTDPKKILEIVEKFLLAKELVIVDSSEFFELSLFVNFLDVRPEKIISAYFGKIDIHQIINPANSALLQNQTGLIQIFLKNIAEKEKAILFLKNVYSNLSEQEIVQKLAKCFTLSQVRTITDIVCSFIPFVTNRDTGEKMTLDPLETEFMGRKHKWITHNWFLNKEGELIDIIKGRMSSGPFTQLFEHNGFVLVTNGKTISIWGCFFYGSGELEGTILAFRQVKNWFFLALEKDDQVVFKSCRTGVWSLGFRDWYNSPRGKVGYIKSVGDNIIKISTNERVSHYQRVTCDDPRDWTGEIKCAPNEDIYLCYQYALPLVDPEFIKKMIEKGFKPLDHFGDLISFTDGKVYTVRGELTEVNPRTIENKFWIF